MPRELALNQLTDRFGSKLQRGAEIRRQHRGSEGFSPGDAPDAVLFADSIDDVAAAVRICAQHQLPVIAHGAGTSLEGHLSAISGGLSLNLMNMNKILDIHAEDLDVRVEAGVTREELNTALKPHGLFWPLDPGANASLGGMAATRASGTNAVRYGTMRELVLGLTLVTADGEIVKTGTRARKSASGLDLTRLFIGSEGTLGIITELTLRVFGIPESILSGLIQFETLEGAIETVKEAMMLAIPLARIELLNSKQMEACIRHSHLDELRPLPSLFLEFHGTPQAVGEQVAVFGKIAAAWGGGDLSVAVKTEDRNRLWKARHNAWFAARALRPGTEAFATDACVPISRLGDAIEATAAALTAEGFDAPLVGHVGDGNYHVVLMYDPANPDECAKAERLGNQIALRALELGGTVTGEHGIGLHKLDALRAEHGDSAIRVMQKIKKALDPLGILNPGKTVPDCA